MESKLYYIVQVNCKSIKKGSIKESEAEAFEEKMIAKYSNNGKNLVNVLYR